MENAAMGFIAAFLNHTSGDRPGSVSDGRAEPVPGTGNQDEIRHRGYAGNEPPGRRDAGKPRGQYPPGYAGRIFDDRPAADG